jgi:aerobic-type carbon monoxide dehydrogenase small subunit (CoxS/CutS family)
MRKAVTLTLNGRPVSLEADDERMLLWVLRTDLALTGTKYGCGQGICGACAVIVDGKARRSCLTPLKAVAGAKVMTVEGLAKWDELHPLQQAFIEHGAFQCGYASFARICGIQFEIQIVIHYPEMALKNLAISICDWVVVGAPSVP